MQTRNFQKSSKKVLTQDKKTVESSTVNEPTMQTKPSPTGLVLNGVTINAQDFGTSILIYLTGEKEAIEHRYYAFYNHGGTNSKELEWNSDTNAQFYLVNGFGKTALEKLQHVLIHCALAQILNTRHTKGQNPMIEAAAIGLQNLNRIQWVTWYRATRHLNIHDFGDSVSAERGTGNFDDDVIAKGLERTGANLDARKLQKELEENEGQTI